MTERDFGDLTAHAVGTLMKEAVRRAIVAIRAHRFSFEATAKTRVGGDQETDFVTTADIAAQRVFTTLLQQWFPGFGIIAEEDTLRVPCTLKGRELWFTVDPLDGTRAFMRRQSHGIGTMIALMDGSEVIAACVGDVMTSEVYAARPDHPAVHRVSEFGIAERMEVDPRRGLGTQYLLRSERRYPKSPWIEVMTDVYSGGEGAEPLFAGLEIATGSLGIGMARLWKGEVGGAVFGPFEHGSPWDLYPVIGISQRLGFVFYALDADGPRPFAPVVDPVGMAVPQQILAVHASRAVELEGWIARRLAHGIAIPGEVCRK